MHIQRPVWAEVDLNAVAHNLGEVRKRTKAKIMAIVKANAYGHGAYPVANTLLKAGADCLGVAILAEALELRAKGITAPILILGYTPEEMARQVVEKDITQTVYTLNQTHALAQAGRDLGKEAKVHIKVDTGMGRIGFPWDGPEAISPVFEMAGLQVEGAFTHLAVADIKDKSFTLEQLDKFHFCLDTLAAYGHPVPLKHAANSAAVIDVPEAHLDMVRPGIMLYGLAPSREVDLTGVDLRPAMTLKAKIALVKNLPAGSSVSYGRTFRAPAEVRVATLPIGYADGYTRLLSNRAEVLIRGRRAPVIGRICMDQCMVDVSAIPEASVGDEAVLFGSDGEDLLPVDELADILGTINYELVCMVSARVPRIYSGNA